VRKEPRKLGKQTNKQTGKQQEPRKQTKNVAFHCWAKSFLFSHIRWPKSKNYNRNMQLICDFFIYLYPMWHRKARKVLGNCGRSSPRNKWERSGWSFLANNMWEITETRPTIYKMHLTLCSDLNKRYIKHEVNSKIVDIVNLRANLFLVQQSIMKSLLFNNNFHGNSTKILKHPLCPYLSLICI